MIKIKIIALGKIKEKPLQELINEYMKRLGRYAKTSIIELSDLPVKENPSPSEIEMVLEKEAKDILKHLSEKSYIISLCIEGKKIDSMVFSEMISKVSFQASEIIFIIGSSHGLSEEIKKKSDYLLSMSDMTFPHNLARLMLIEQIYRSFKILGNEAYHK